MVRERTVKPEFFTGTLCKRNRAILTVSFTLLRVTKLLRPGHAYFAQGTHFAETSSQTVVSENTQNSPESHTPGAVLLLVNLKK